MQGALSLPVGFAKIVRPNGIVHKNSNLVQKEPTAPAFMRSLVEEHPDLYLQVRTHDDFARAKRENRVGILLGFEHANVLEGKLDRIETFRGLAYG